MQRPQTFRPDKRIHFWATVAIVILWGIAGLTLATDGPVQRTMLFGLGGLVAAGALLYRERIDVLASERKIVRASGFPMMLRREEHDAADIAAVGLARVGEGKHSTVQLDLRLRPDYTQLVLMEAPALRAGQLAEIAHSLAGELRAPIEIDDGFEAALSEGGEQRDRSRAYRRKALFVLLPLTFVIALAGPYVQAVRDGVELPFWQAILEWSRPPFRRPSPARILDWISMASAALFLVLSSSAYMRYRKERRRLIEQEPSDSTIPSYSEQAV